MNLSQARPNILSQLFLIGCFLQEHIETQNLGKAQALGALPAVATLRNGPLSTADKKVSKLFLDSLRKWCHCAPWQRRRRVLRRHGGGMARGHADPQRRVA